MLLFRVKIEAQSLDLDHLKKVLTATFFGSIDILPLPVLVCSLDFEALQNQAKRVGLIESGKMILKSEVNILYTNRNIIENLHCKFAEVSLIFIPGCHFSLHLVQYPQKHFLQMTMSEYVLENPISFVLWRNDNIEASDCYLNR